MSTNDLNLTIPDVPGAMMPPILREPLRGRGRRVRPPGARAARRRRRDAPGRRRHLCVKAADAKALAAAMAAGKPDPGARHESKLREEFAKHRRRVDGFGMAATDAYRRLLAAMEEHGDRWADELGSESNTAAERVTTLAVDLEKALADADGVARISDWLGAARRPGRVGGLPAPSGRTSSVNLGGSPWTRDAVLGALMASVTR